MILIATTVLIIICSFCTNTAICHEAVEKLFLMFPLDESNWLNDIGPEKLPISTTGNHKTEREISGPFGEPDTSHSLHHDGKPLVSISSNHRSFLINKLTARRYSILFAFFADTDTELVSFHETWCVGPFWTSCFTYCIDHLMNTLELTYKAPDSLIIMLQNNITAGVKIPGLIQWNKWNKLSVAIDRVSNTITIQNNYETPLRFANQVWLHRQGAESFNIGPVCRDTVTTKKSRNSFACVSATSALVIDQEASMALFENCRKLQKGRVNRTATLNLPKRSELLSFFPLNSVSQLVDIGGNKTIVRSLHSLRINSAFNGPFQSSDSSFTVADNSASMFSVRHENWNISIYNLTISLAFFAQKSPTNVITFSDIKCFALQISYVDSSNIVFRNAKNKVVTSFPIVQPRRWNFLTFSFTKSQESLIYVTIFSYDSVLVDNALLPNLALSDFTESLSFGAGCFEQPFLSKNAMACLAIYKTAIKSQSDVRQIIDSCKAFQTVESPTGPITSIVDSMLGFWPFDVASGLSDQGPNKLEPVSNYTHNVEFTSAFDNPFNLKGLTTLTNSAKSPVESLLDVLTPPKWFNSSSFAIFVAFLTESTAKPWPFLSLSAFNSSIACPEISFLVGPPSNLYIHVREVGIVQSFPYTVAIGSWNLIAITVDRPSSALSVHSPEASLVPGVRISDMAYWLEQVRGFQIGGNCSECHSQIQWGFHPNASISCLTIFDDVVPQSEISKIVDFCGEQLAKRISDVDEMVEIKTLNDGDRLAIIISSLAAVLILASAMAALWKLRRDRRRRFNEILRISPDKSFDEIVGKFPSGIKATLAAIDRLQINSDCIELTDDSLGSGLFSTVLKAVLRDERGLKTTVAVKKLRDGYGTLIPSFYQEALIMGDLSHENVLNLIGIVTINREPMLVLPHMEKGCLRRLLMHEGDQLPCYLLLQFSMQVCKGMCYLSSKNLIHRDLASRNILVTKSLLLKIADFGLAEMAMAEKQDIDGIVPIRWHPPESFLDNEFDSKSDVWSFGVLVWEIFSFGALPYGELDNADVKPYVASGKRLSCPKICPSRIYELLTTKCWNVDRKQRSTFDDILETLNKIYVDSFEVTDM